MDTYIRFLHLIIDKPSKEKIDKVGDAKIIICILNKIGIRNVTQTTKFLKSRENMDPNRPCYGLCLNVHTKLHEVIGGWILGGV